MLRVLTPQIDQLIAVSSMIEDKLVQEGRTSAPVRRISNGVDLSRYDHTEPCCTLPEEYGMEPGSQIVGVVARLEPETRATVSLVWRSGGLAGSATDFLDLVREHQADRAR